MNVADVSAQILEELRALWRMRAALAFFRSIPASRMYAVTPLAYENVPDVDGCRVFDSRETVLEALDATASYEQERMAGDAFLVILAPLERYLSDRLAATGVGAQGTLGYLQRSAETKFAVSGPEVSMMDEVRERRNCLIHDHGIAGQKYCDAASRAAPHSGGRVVPVAVGSRIGITWQYLSYAAEVLVRYAKLYP